MENKNRDTVVRRETILQQLTRNGSIRVKELSEQLRISSVTIRSDLTAMERENLLTRTHGGAVVKDKAYLKIRRAEQKRQNADRCAAIARCCAAHIHDGETLLLNAGAISERLISELANRRSITVITNSLPVMQEAAAYDTIEIIALGGKQNKQGLFLYGAEPLGQLQGYMADRAILSVDGLTGDCLSVNYHEETSVVRAMLERAHAAFVLVDGDGVGRVAHSIVPPADNIQRVITNADANEATLKRLRALGMEVELTHANIEAF